jgi:hypothetical protein
MRTRLTALVVTIAAALLPVSASASTGELTITLGTPTVAARVLVSVPMAVVCTDIPGPTPVSDIVFVSLEQASGQSVTQGTGQLGQFFFPTLLLTCDGVTVNHLTVSVLANAGGTPWHGGPAILSAFVIRFYLDNESISASTGPVTVNLTG